MYYRMNQVKPFDSELGEVRPQSQIDVPRVDLTRRQFVKLIGVTGTAALASLVMPRNQSESSATAATQELLEANNLSDEEILKRIHENNGFYPWSEPTQAHFNDLLAQINTTANQIF